MRKQVKILHQQITFTVSLVTFPRAPLGLILAEVAAGHPSRYIVPGSEVDGPDDDVRLPAAAVVVVLPTVRLRLPCSHKGVNSINNIRRKHFLASSCYYEGRTKTILQQSGIFSA